LELKDKIIKRFNRIFEIKTFEKTSDWKHDALLIFPQEKLRFFSSKFEEGGGVVKVSVIPFENPLQKPITTFLQMKWTKLKRKEK